MTRKLTLVIALATVTAMGSLAAADQPVRTGSPFRTAEYSQGDAEIVEVRRGRGYRRGYDRRYNYYSPYQSRYYDPYRYGYGYRYPQYYGPRNYGYYNYGRRGGGVQIGPYGVWW